MLLNYFRVLFRSIRKSPGYFFINVLGISVSLMCVMLIALFVKDELSFDRSTEQNKNVYRISADEKRETGEIVRNAFSPLGWGPLLKSTFPEVKNSCRFMHYRLDMLIANPAEDKSFYEKNFLWADSTVFQVMPIELIKGNPKTALRNLNAIVISESAALRYFGKEDPMGKALRFQNTDNVEVTGVMRDIPEHSHFKADFFRSFEQMDRMFESPKWSLLYFYTYLLLDEGTDPDLLLRKFKPELQKNLKPEIVKKFEPTISGYGDIYLHSDRTNELVTTGNYPLVIVLIQIALLILAMASANFINLSTARSLLRAKEIGIRKTLGSLRSSLVRQFLGESIVYMIFGLSIALLLTQVSLPYFNRLTGKQIHFLDRPDFMLLMTLLVLAVVVGICAGAYPALQLSSFSPIHALKGSFKKSKDTTRIRQALVVFQFVICSLLVTASMLIYQQVEFMNSKDPGYSIEQTIFIPITTIEIVPFNTFPILKNEFAKLPGVRSVAFSSHKITGDQPYDADYYFEDSGLEVNTLTMGRIHIDFDFVKTYDLHLAAGRDLSERLGADTSSFLINQSAVKTLGFKSDEEALGRKVSYQTTGIRGSYRRSGTIVGVVRDYNFLSLHHAVQPMVMDVQPARYHCITVKLSTKDMKSTLQDLENKWRDIVPTTPFQFDFMDQVYRRQYETERNISRLTQVLSFISIMIAVLGLVGLASFMLEQRKKEIGIRKVNGASSFGVIILFSKEFLKVFLIGFTIAIPVSLYFSKNWLNQFAYHVDISIALLLLSLVLIVLIAWMSIAYQTIKASLVNPVKVLRQE